MPLSGYGRFPAYAEPYGEYRILWCLVQGDCTLFKVTAPLNFDIDDLKEVIHNKWINTTKFFVLPKDLILYKLRESEPLEPDDTFVHRVSTKFSNLSKVATELSPWKKLSALFTQQPPQDYLHIIIQTSNSQKHSNPTAADSNDYPSKKSRSSDMVLDEDSLLPTGGVLHMTVPYTGYHSERRLFFQLNCLVAGDDHNRIFIIQIEASQTVAALKDAIKKKKPALDHKLADTLDLWKVSLIRETAKVALAAYGALEST